MPAITFNDILKAEQTPTGCGVLVLRDGKVLAGSRIERAGKGKLCGPGGHIEPGETPEEGARREAYEEFGIVCNELVPLGVQTGRGRHGKSAVFLCSDFSGEPKTDEEEMTEPQWIRPEEIAEEDAYPPFFQSLELLPVAKTFAEILKFNPNHDNLGRFSSSNGGGGGAAATGGGEPSFLDENGEFDPFAAIMWAAEHPDEVEEPEKPIENWQKPYQMVDGKDLTQGSKEDRQRVADMTIEEILKEQGFDGKPKVATTMEEFSDAVKENGNIAARGISANLQENLDAYTDQLMNGEFYVECSGGSKFGRGMYMASSWDGVIDYDVAFAEADKYAGMLKYGKVINMTLDKSANIADFHDLFNEAFQDGEPFINASNLSKDSRVRSDIGAYAAAKGYDAIRCPEGYTVVLNRTKLTIFDQSGNIEFMDGGEDLLFGDWDLPAWAKKSARRATMDNKPYYFDWANGVRVKIDRKTGKKTPVDEIVRRTAEKGELLTMEQSMANETEMEKSFTIFKADEDKRLVFGWASVIITVDGEELEDLQHDMIDPEDLEEAAYEYVLNFRDTGEEHLPGYRKKGKLVESCVFTQEKQRAMGIPEGILPVAWWIGFKIDDEATWQKIKDGTYKMFSIEGKAQREPVEKAAYDEWLEENMDKFSSEEEERKFAQWKSSSGFRARSATDVDEVDMQWDEYKNVMSKNQAHVAKTFDEVLKFNPYHDALGRFSSSGGATFMTVFTNSPAGQKAIANIKAKQQAAQQAAAATAPPAPAKPKVNYDAKGFADHDDADYHQLYNRKQYYQQQQLTAQQKKSADSYVDPNTEPGSLYNVAQNLNWQMVNGQKLSPKYQKVHDDMMDSMHNIGYNVNLTRYDHAGMVNSMLQGLGAGSDYTRMSQSQLKKALVGKSMAENKMISTTTNDFSNAPRNVQSLFRDRAVKINYKTKANVQGLLMPIGSGGDQGELVLAPTGGKGAKNAAPKITDVRYTGKTVYRAKTGRSYPQIEIDVEWD